MSVAQLFRIAVIVWITLATPAFLALLFVSAPYGRHLRQGWGPRLSARWGWVWMETPAVLVFLGCYCYGDASWQGPGLAFLLLWQAHYVHRAWIYPGSLRVSGKQMPLLIVGLGMLFGIVNALINGIYLFVLPPGKPQTWLSSPAFIVGALLFGAGFVINRQADAVLHRLRKPGETGYRIPYGGLYRWISCPNYFGEILQWSGWAIATWSLPGLAFAIWSAANLAPRARAHHSWYQQTFPDYPAERRALLPGFW